MFFYFFEDVMRVLLVILLFLGFTVSAFAVWDSKGYVMNYSHYLLKPTSAGWHISEGHKIYENLQMIGPTKEPSDYTPVYPTYVIGVSFNNGLSEAEAIYEKAGVPEFSHIVSSPPFPEPLTSPKSG